MQVLFHKFVSGQDITVYDTTEWGREKGRFRVLQFADDASQGAMDLEHPGRILFEYPKAMLHLMEYNHPRFENVFIIGHGIGTMARSLPDKRVKTAELNGEVLAVSRTFFGYAGDHVSIGDGRELLGLEKPEAYDYIVLDAFSGTGTPRHLTTLEFFRLTREKLDQDGAVLINLMGRGAEDEEMKAVHAALCRVYPYVRAFYLPPEGPHIKMNILLSGSGNPLHFQARRMSGFVLFTPGPGEVVTDFG